MVGVAGAVCRGWAAATPDPLLDILIKKGILTEQEAEQVKQEASATQTNAMPPVESSKWRISDAIKSIQLFGDIRLRYEDRVAKAPDYSFVRLQRLRYALRFGFRGDVEDNFYYGFRLETSANPRSPWNTFGSSSSTSANAYQAPFGKGTAGISVGQIYLGWRPTDWLDITAGKMPMPLYTTPMVWDSDYNPEGLAEHFKYTVGKADLFGNFGQFLYLDVNPTETSQFYFPAYQAGAQNSLPFLLAWQIGANVHVTKDVSVKVAPTLYNYTGEGVDSVSNGNGQQSPGFADIFVGQGAIGTPANGINPPNGLSGYGQGINSTINGIPTQFDGFTANQTGINNLLILDIPAEVDFKIEGLSAKVFGDFAENLDGNARAIAAYNAALLSPTTIQPIAQPELHQDKAYQAGFAIGSGDELGLVYGTTAKKNAWEARAYWQHVEQYALDPNLLDSDFFEGRGNLQGFYSAFAYGLAANIIGTIHYGYASRIDERLGTGGSNLDIPQVNPIRQYQIFQLDLTCRF
jgi:hypothetical protein